MLIEIQQKKVSWSEFDGFQNAQKLPMFNLNVWGRGPLHPQGLPCVLQKRMQKNKFEILKKSGSWLSEPKWSKKVCFSWQRSFQLILQQLPQKLLGRPQAAPQAAPQARAPLDVPLLGLGGPAWAVGMPSIENHQVIWNLSPKKQILSSIHIVCLKIGMPRL